MSTESSQKYAFLFTDIEGSTKLAQQYPELMTSLLDKHNEVMAKVFAQYKGQIFQTVGDAYCVAFENTEDAVKAAVDSQRRLSEVEWGEAVIKVRMGVHTGFAQRTENNFSGYITMARTHRIMSAANGGQILVSQPVHDEIRNELTGKVGFKDLGERRLKDLIQPVRIYQITAEGIEEEFPALKTLDARPNNLPIQLTSFIGREKELQSLKEALQETRLLTLLGSGGSGKTRLALQAGAELIDNFANGVWIVELEQVTDPFLLPAAINTALGVQEESQRPPEETLAEHVKDKELLLILDNCEQIAEACARISEKLLKRSPRLTIIVTSREALKCEGELTHRIDSLKSPVKGKKYSHTELMDFESVRLFAERAQAISPSFSLTDDNASTVGDICSDLDGIPLAIELAAARIKVLPVEKIRERLSDRFKLLTGGKRTALPRQQTLKALIDWSYELLTEQEKVLWERLSVFSGGWNLESAEEICSDDQIDNYEILDLLFNLTEKSIVIFDSDNERYRMLESIRQYGDEKLSLSGSRDVFYSRHLTHYKDFAVKSEEGLSGDSVTKWLKMLDNESGNLEAALNRSYNGGSNEDGGILAVAYANYWLSRGLLTTAVHYLENILERSKDITRTTKGNLLSILGLFSNMLGNADKAEKLIEESLEIARETGNKDDIASCLNNLASVVYEKGDYTKARELIEETLSIDREGGDEAKISFSLVNLGTVARLQGDFENAKALLEESLQIRKKAKNKFAIVSSLNTLVMLHLNLGEFERSRSYIEESLKFSDELGSNFGIADGNLLLANLESALGNFDKAESLLRESLSVFEEMGKKNKSADCMSSLGNIFYQTERFEEAVELLKKSLELQRAIGDKFGIGLTLLRLGKALIQCNKEEEATRCIEESFEIRSKLGLKAGIAECMNSMAMLLLSKELNDEAIALFRQSVLIQWDLRNKAGVLSNLLGIAHTLQKQNRKEDCIKIFQLAAQFIKAQGTLSELGTRTIYENITEEYTELKSISEDSAEISLDLSEISELLAGILDRS